MSSSVSPVLIKESEVKVSTSEANKLHLNYRPDIDGMRALAILAVVIYHAFPQSVTGGFVGVDVFFVISGYLISSIIMKGVADGSFSFYDFYMRRVRRIFPALMLVLAATFAAGWAVMMGDEFKSLSKHIIAGIAFVQNIMMYTESGYFDASAETKPLMHLWSLGVEEQFYLVFPIILILLHRFRIGMMPSLLGMAFLSFVMGVMHMSDTPAGVFFLPQYRFWELLFGSLLAYVSLNASAHKFLPKSSAVKDILSVLGLLLILIAVTFIDKNKRLPGYWALLPVIGSTLLIYSGPGAWVNKNVLSSRVLVFVGLISYPLYLWHWPLFSFAYIYLSGTPTALVRLALIFLAFALAFLTYRFLELPLRHKVSGKKAFAALVAVSISFIAVSAVVFQKNGLPDRQNEKQYYAEYFSNSRPSWHYFTENKIPERYRYDCDWYNQAANFSGNPTDTPVPSISEKCFKSSSAKKVLFWGDSHSQQYIYGVTHELPQGIGVLSVASSACIPNLPELDEAPGEFCRKSNQFAIQTIKDQKPDVVVLGQVVGHDVMNNFPKIA
ncbi:MAG: acyltransferase family protein, partial [Hafnia sp.]